jgi:hypothetical protein
VPTVYGSAKIIWMSIETITGESNLSNVETLLDMVLTIIASSLQGFRKGHRNVVRSLNFQLLPWSYH